MKEGHGWHGKLVRDKMKWTTYDYALEKLEKEELESERKATRRLLGRQDITE